MGFGILFIGYFFTFVGALAIPVSKYTFVLGAGIILFSLKKLILENKMFLISAIFAGVFEFLSIAVLFLSLFAPNTLIGNILFSVQLVAASALNILLLLAIYKISKDVGATKIQSKAIINLVVGTISLIFMLLSVVLPNAGGASRCFFVGYVACVIYTIFTLVTIFNCYASICYEGDENMDNETTGIKPLDFLNKALNKVMFKNKDNDKTGKKK